VKIAMLMANPRKSGYTQQLVDLFIKGARASDASVDLIDLTAADIRPCIGCYHCWLVTPGVCIHKDDFPAIADRFGSADIAVLVSPLYAFAISTVAKSFCDRIFAFTKQGFVETPNGDLRNSVRNPQHWPKALAWIMVGAFRKVENFEGADKSLSLFAQSLDLVAAGHLFRPESYLLQFTFAKPKTIKIIETAFEQAGHELGTSGRISAETAARAATPLSSDNTHFQKYANIFWEHAGRMGEEALDLKRVGARVVGDMRVLLSEMVRSVDTLATAKMKFSLQFDFTDSDRHFRVSVDHGSANLTEEKSDSCDLRITCAATTWAGVFMRSVNVRDALQSHDIMLEGDKSIFSRLDRYFPPPSS
jgi:putative NADPH-quinone reductase/putative sterol carrier protein